MASAKRDFYGYVWGASGQPLFRPEPVRQLSVRFDGAEAQERHGMVEKRHGMVESGR
jgi:hypothetical protein